MPWKYDEEGTLVKGEDNNPIWIYEEGNEKGKEVSGDFNRMFSRINELTTESVARKTKIKEIEELYKPLVELNVENLEEWLGEATKALDTVSNLKDKDVLAAGEVEKIKQGVIDSYEQKMKALKDQLGEEITGLQGQIAGKDDSIRNLIVRSAFDRSEFLNKKTTLLPDMAYKYFGDRFDVENVEGQLVGFAKDKEGNKLMSLEKPGEYASPEEAIELIIMDFPQKDHVLKQESAGSGSGPSAPGQGGDLLAQYKEAKQSGNIQAQIALKNQMQAKGIKAPL